MISCSYSFTLMALSAQNAHEEYSLFAPPDPLWTMLIGFFVLWILVAYHQ